MNLSYLAACSPPFSRRFRCFPLVGQIKAPSRIVEYNYHKQRRQLENTPP